MALVKLQTEHFRNLAPGAVSFSPSFNLIYGANGSGKTSVLEAIGYLGLGRSFRVTRHQAVVRHGETRFTVFGALDGESGEIVHRLGFSRDLREQQTVLRVDGENVRSLSALARHLPVSVIDPGVFDIVARGARQTTSVSGLGCVPRGTFFCIRMAAVPEGHIAAESDTQK